MNSDDGPQPESKSTPPERGSAPPKAGSVRPVTSEEADRVAASIRPSWDLEAWSEGGDGVGEAPAAALAMPEVAAPPAAVEARPVAVADAEPAPDALPVTPVKRNPFVLAALAAALALGAVFAFGVFDRTESEHELWSTSPGPATVSAPAGARREPTASVSAAEPTPDPHPLAAAPTKSRADDSTPMAPGATNTQAAQAPTPTSPPTPALAVAEPAPRPPSPVSAAEAPTLARPSRAGAAPRSTSATPPAPATNTARIRIRTQPEAAILTMDGTRIANPFDARLARTGTHRIEARAEGFESRTVTTSFDQDRLVTLRLRATPRVRPEAPRPTPQSDRPRTQSGASLVTDNPY